jgi:hypothetical protein
MGTPYCEECGFSTCQCKRGRGSSEPRPPNWGPVAQQRIDELELANNSARTKLCRYAAELNQVWELLDDVVRHNETPGFVASGIPEDGYRVSIDTYDEIRKHRQKVGLLLQEDPWDGEEMLSDLVAIRQDLNRKERGAEG